MNIHYKIVELWPDDHLIVARYWTDNITEEMLASDTNRKEDGTPVRCRTDVALNLPVPTPPVNDVDILVKRNVPLSWLKMMESKLDPDIDTEVDHINDLLNIKKTAPEEEMVLPPPLIAKELSKELSEEDIQKLIENITK
jgi:hypothetical protein